MWQTSKFNKNIDKCTQKTQKTEQNKIENKKHNEFE